VKGDPFQEQENKVLFLISVGEIDRVKRGGGGGAIVSQEFKCRFYGLLVYKGVDAKGVPVDFLLFILVFYNDKDCRWARVKISCHVLKYISKEGVVINK
jgi:hypothetical protein